MILNNGLRRNQFDHLVRKIDNNFELTFNMEGKLVITYFSYKIFLKIWVFDVLTITIYNNKFQILNYKK